MKIIDIKRVNDYYKKMIEVRRRRGEPINAFLFRFSKKIKQSGVLIEAKKRRYQNRPISKAKRKRSAIYRAEKKREFEILKKKGLT